MSDDDVVRLATASTPFEAHLWRQALEEEKIRCKVVGEYLDAGLGDVPGIRPEVWVHRDDYDRAKAILDAHTRTAEGPADEEA
jgi:hypothetical protein